jgi:hypothetical protein
MTDDPRQKCEAENGTAHLPECVRDAIWHVAYEHHHSCGVGEVVNMYDEYAGPAILAFHEARREERARVLAYVAGWGDMSAKVLSDLHADLTKAYPL